MKPGASDGGVAGYCGYISMGSGNTGDHGPLGGGDDDDGGLSEWCGYISSNE
jgi:hypothetical protein